MFMSGSNNRGIPVSKRDQKKHQKEVKRKQQKKDRTSKERLKNALPPREIRNVIIAARSLMEDREFEEAEDTLLDARRRFPGNADIHEELLSFYQDRRDYIGMEKVAPVLSRLRPNDPDTQLILAQTYLFRQRFGLAMLSYRAFLERWPDSPRASKARTALEVLEKNIDDPLQAFGLTRDELPILAMHDRVLHHISGHQFAEAARLAEELIRLKPDLPSVRNNLIMSWFQLGRFKEAQSQARETAIRFPNNLFAQSQFGVLSFLSGSLQEAKDTAARATAFLRETFDADSKSISDGVLKLLELLSFLGDDEAVLEVAGLSERLNEVGTEHRSIAGQYKAVALFRLDRRDEAIANWQLSQKELPGYSLPSENLADLRQPKQGHAPWALPITSWMPGELLTELRTHLSRRGAEIGETASLIFGKWPQLKALIPHMLDRGDPRARELAFRVAMADRSQDMLQSLLEFATGKRGPQNLRMEALQMLKEEGFIDNSPINFFHNGTWTQIGLNAMDVHWNSSPHPNPEINDLLAECYHAIEDRDVDQSLELSNRCVQADPDFPTCWFHRATALQLTGKPDDEREAKAIILELHQRFPDYVFAIISLANDAIEEDRLEDAKNLLWPLTSRTSWHGSEYLAYMSVQIRLCLAHGKIDSALSLLEAVKKFQPADSRIQMLELMIARAKLNSERGSML